MRFGLKNSFFKIFAAAVFGILPQTGAEAYNLAPQSFENFYAVAAEGDLQGLKNMQRRGLNMDATNQNGDTAVCVAVKKQDYLAYKTLIRAGAKSHPACLEKIPEYAHKSFLANYNQKYAAPETPTNWTKNGTALVIGGGIAAGVVALVGVGGGGSGGGHSDEVPDAKACDLNPCAPGCYQNTVCAAGFECTQYESKCNLGCIKCEQKPECVNVPECTAGCYVNLTCQEGYECSSRNRCGGCESCRQKTECQKNQCAAGCFRNLNCGSDKTCTLQNGCGGCEKCELLDPDKPDTSNARHCLVYDHSINYCTTCRDGYVSINGTCKLAAPDNCKTYSYNTEKCTECDDGYKLESEGRKCTKDGNGTTTCTAANYPLQSCPANAQTCDNCTPTGATSPIYKINTCKTGYTLSSDKKSCEAIPAGSCTAANYPLTSKPANATSESCTDGSTTRYKITSCNTGYTLSVDKKTCQKSGEGNTDPTCTAAEYPALECPSTAECAPCTDGSIRRYKITKCLFATVLNASKTDCVNTDTLECNKENFPLTKSPDNANSSSCSPDGTNVLYRLNYCNDGYYESSDKTTCYKTCKYGNYPLQSCPTDGVCDDCIPNGNSTTAYKLLSCKYHKKVSDDETSCVEVPEEECTTEAYPLSKCPMHATCTYCYGDNEEKAQISFCWQGYSLNDDGTACVENKEDTLCNETAYPLTSCPYEAECSKCTNNNSYRYKITKCITGYEFDELGVCKRQAEINPWGCTGADYPLLKCPLTMECGNCIDGTGTTRYQSLGCKAGYKYNEDSSDCIPDETQNCDTSYYPFESCPNGANCSRCTDSNGVYFGIYECWVNWKLAEDGLSCIFQGTDECNAANFPVVSMSCPVGSICSSPHSCSDGENSRWRIIGCNKGWTLKPGGMYCLNEDEDCSIATHPLKSCPPNAQDCDTCGTTGTVKILSCNINYVLSEDGLSCVYQTCDSSYNLSSCPNFAECDNCTDANGTHVKFKSCIGGYVRDGINTACVQKELKPLDNDVVNDANISIGKKNATTYTDNNNSYSIGFTNYGKDEDANLYNAQNKDASISLGDVSDFDNYVVGFGSPVSKTANVINAYNGHTGSIEMSGNNKRPYGIITNNNAYNSYNANGKLKMSITDEYAAVRGITSFNNNSGTIYNAFEGNGDIHIETNSNLTLQPGMPWAAAIGMGGYNVINAANGGIGNLYIKSSGVFYGLASNIVGDTYYNNYGLVANAYATDNKQTIGNIDLYPISNTTSHFRGYAIGLRGGKEMYNAYGVGAEGNITISAEIDATGIKGAALYYINTANGANGGVGKIKITNSGNTYFASALEPSKYNGSTFTAIQNGFNAINGGTGYIDIELDATLETEKINERTEAFGIRGAGGNGAVDGSIGYITITDKGDNDIIGIFSDEVENNYSTHNYKGSSIELNSSANKDSNVIGIKTAGASYNYGDIKINLTNRATAYGIYMTRDGVTENYTATDNATNVGTITINREYTDNNIEASDTASSDTYGMIGGHDKINRGEIIINGPTAPAANQKDYIYGMYESAAYGATEENKTKIINYGTIKVTGGYQHYGMYNNAPMGSYNLSYNYGTVYGDMLNVHNAAGAKLYGKFEVENMYEGVNNGDAEHIATSANDQDNGYIEYTLSDDDAIAISVKPLYSSRKDYFHNYGVINIFNNSNEGAVIETTSDNVHNYGYIKLTNQKDNATFSAVGKASTRGIVNHGTIEITSNDKNNITMAGAIITDGSYSSANTGHIKIDMGNSANSTAYGFYQKNVDVLTKKGSDIIITSTNNGTAYGIYVDNAKAINHGNITLTGVNPDTSYGIYAVNSSTVYNDGTITINGESYSDNAASEHFIYIDASSSFTTNGYIYVPESFDTAALGGGKFVLGKDGKITAPEIKGDITADAGITSGGFDKTYSNKNAFSGKTDEVKLNSGSALFDAALKNNDIVMTMKDFDEVVDDKSLASYLQRNYEAKRNEQLFNSLKLQTTSARLNSSLNQQLGFSLLPNFAQENMNVFRSLSNLVTDTMFSQDLTNERMMVGYDYLGQDRSSKGRVTGYENTANSSYFLADTKLNNRQRFGLGVALTRFNSDYDDDSSRKATFAQAMGSYMHDFGNRWKYAGLLRVGYADGDYKRQSDSERVSGDTSDILYGFNNELRYNYDLGFMTLEPQVELNAYGYYQRKIKENDEKISALLVDGTNNLSIEAGAGLYAGKETVYGETGRVKARLGGSYYRELSQPYHTMRARVRDTDGYYLIESTDIFDRNRVIVRADITFSWKAFDFYLRGSQFMEDKHTTVINAGIKFNF